VNEYVPNGAPLASGQPTVQSYVLNADGSYTLTGTLLNGISEGANYGDDAMSSTNFPLVRLTNSAGNVYYCRTFNWNTTNVMTGSTPQTTQFTLPAGLPSGSYALQVVTNGIPSNNVHFQTGGTTGSSFFEAEALAVLSETSGVQTGGSADPNDSAGNAEYFDATAVGQYIDLLVPNITAGTYDVRIGMKKGNNRGRWQLNCARADGTDGSSNVGPVVDEYSANTTYTYVDLGNWAPGTTSDKAFKFTVTGKNASSSSDWVVIDYIQLIAQ
jgi:hypothetical protein